MRKKSSKNTSGVIKPTKYKFQIAVSGAAAGETVEDEEDLILAEQIGEEVAKRGYVLVTGATTGLPYASAIGAKRAGGLSIGVSPATSHYEHITRYKLPDDAFDVIIYTGFGYTGRNLFIVRSADALISIGGRIGTLNEFTIAYEEKIPVGVLVGTGGVADDIKHILRIAGKGDTNVLYHSSASTMLDAIEAELTGKNKMKYPGSKVLPSKTTRMIVKKIKRISTRPDIG